jgi:hypothetical protein
LIVRVTAGKLSRAIDLDELKAILEGAESIWHRLIFRGIAMRGYLLPAAPMRQSLADNSAE